MASKIKLIITGLITGIIIFAGGIFTGKYKFSTQDIKVVEKKVYETKWKTKIKYVNKEPEFTKENFDISFNCMMSSLNFKDYTENNYLFITAFDDCKEATARYEIGTKNNWRVYLIWAGIGAAVTAGTVWYYNR